MERAAATTADSAVTVGASARQRRSRRWLVRLLLGVTAVAVFVSSIAVWSHRVLLDTDEWVATVGPLADNPDVTRAVAVYLVDQALTAVDVEQRAAEALPERAAFLARPLASALREQLTETASGLLETEQFRTLWVEANRVAHRRAVQLLTGESAAGLAPDGSVTLNLVPAIALLLQRMDDLGILPSAFAPPTVDWTAPAAQSIADLEDALGVELRPGFGQITVFRSTTLAVAQDSVALFERLVAATVVVALALAAACVALAVDRRRTIVLLGLGTAGALLLSGVVVSAAAEQVVDLVSDGVDRSAAAAVVRRVVGSLEEITRGLALIGVLVAGVAFLAGGNPTARRLRAWARPAAPGGRPAALDAGAVRSAVTRHRDALSLAAFLAALLALVVLPPSFAVLAAVGVVLGLFLGLVALLAMRPSSVETGAPPLAR